jgi:hypothetical protein
VAIENWDYATPDVMRDEISSLRRRLEDAERRAERAESLLRRLVDAWDAATDREQFDSDALDVVDAARPLLKGE